MVCWKAGPIKIAGEIEFKIHRPELKTIACWYNSAILPLGALYYIILLFDILPIQGAVAQLVRAPV